MGHAGRISLLLAVSLALVRCGVGAVDTAGSCATDVLFSAAPLDLDDIASIRPLGGLNPPSHVFPTDHIYFYMPRDANGVPLVVPFYSPGDMTVTSISASQHVNAGFTDFTLELSPCQEVTVVFMHITSLDPGIFGDTSSFDGWALSNEYTTGGETYRLWRKSTSIELRAGQKLGTTGGRHGQYALDMGVYDRRRPAEAVANPARWTNSSVLYAVCPFDYYADDGLRDALLDLIERDVTGEDSNPCATVFQDVPGTAQGCWFLTGVRNTYPEDAHLALVYSNLDPSRAVFSTGTSIQGLGSGLYGFAPRSSGALNRRFCEVRADGTIYGFQVEGYHGVIIVHMPDAETLWIEALPIASSNPATWILTNRKTVFER